MKKQEKLLEISQATSKCQNWQVRKGKNELDTIEFFTFELVKVTNFNLTWQVWRFGWSNFSKNGIFGWKEKSQLHFWILLIWISLDTKFQLKLTILIFWTKFTHGVFLEKKNRKSEHKHWNMNIQINVDIKLQFKLTILFFSPTKFAQRGYFWSKAE